MTAPITSNEPTTTRLHHYAGHYSQPCGDDATNDTSTATDAGQRETTITNARPQTATIETGITSAPENCTENAHFAPAKGLFRVECG